MIKNKEVGLRIMTLMLVMVLVLLPTIIAIEVECTNNAVCVDKFNNPNMVCVDFKCKESTSRLGYCGDGKCEDVIGETPTSCPKDCSSNYQPQTTSKNNSLIGYVILAIVIIIGFIILAIVLRKRKRK